MTERPILHALPDPAERPLAAAAASLACCASTTKQPVKPEDMMLELRAALSEFSPGGHFRTPDIRLAAQTAVLDSMFHIGVKDAVRFKQILVEPGSLENGLKDKYEDGPLYLDQDSTLLALRVQNQCRQTIHNLKASDAKAQSHALARKRYKLEKSKQS